MKRRIDPFISLIAVMLMITSACTSEVTEEFPVESNSFTIDLLAGKIETRAVGEEQGDKYGSFNENKIDELDIFFYEGDVLKWHVSNPAYDAVSRIATIPVTAEKRALFLNNTTVNYDIHVVANNTADISSILEGGNNLQELKDLVLQTESFVDNGGNTSQPSFVMDGVTSQIVNINSPDLGTVQLKRAASKIRLRVLDVNVPGYVQVGDASVRLVHFTTKSALLEGGAAPVLVSDDWKNTSGQSVSTTHTDGGKTTAAPFYAYENDWSAEKNRETYLELYVPLKKEGENEEVQSYKYRVPVTPSGLTGDEEQYMNKLQRNFLYDISVNVKILGSREEPPVELEGNYTIIDWETLDILVDITGAHYLVVSERHVVMPNVTTYTLQFNSSIPDVKLVAESLTATYTYVSASTGQPVTENVAGGQMPSVIVQSNVASGNITVSSPIPVNFIPKDIEFKVTNGPLTETITIQQLPATYFTVTKGVQSYMIDNGSWGIRYQLPSNLNNPYMYAITSLAPAGDLVWGFPPVDSDGRTIDSEEVSNMISPKFEMASQFGASLPKNYINAQEQCRRYTETAEGGVVKTGWRLPTEAEIKYIDDIQNISGGQGLVMTARWYWDSYSSNGAYRMQGGSDGSSTSAYVRCIRDIKD